jgi:multiple sugar transport system permease protein
MIGPHERGRGLTAWVFRAVALVLFVGTLTTLYPLIWLVGNAFKSPEEYKQTPLQIAPSTLAPDVTKGADNRGAGRLDARVVSREAVQEHRYDVTVADEGQIEIISDDGRLWSMEPVEHTEIVIDGVSFGLMGQMLPGDRFEVEMRTWQTGNYAEAWEGVRFVRHSVNTFVLMAAIWTLHILINSLAAYALSRLPFPGSRFVMFGFLMTMMVPWYAIFIPLYLTVTDLQLTRPLWGWPAVILPAGFNAFFLILFKSFFDGLPGALIDASRIDGASEMQTFLHVALPLAKPIFAVITVFSLLATWNDFLWPYLVIAQEDGEPLMVRLYHFENTGAPTEQVLAGLAMAMVPPIVLFVVFQRQIAAGFTLSGVKG